MKKKFEGENMCIIISNAKKKILLSIENKIKKNILLLIVKVDNKKQQE